MLPYINIGSRLISMYGVCMGVGLLVSAYIAYLRVKKANGDENSLIIIAAFAIGLGLVSAKLLYIIVSYGIDKALGKITEGDFSFLSEGGQVFYGGLIGGIIGAILGARFAKENLSLYCDAIVPCIPLGHAFGRLGCFFAGCCYGMPYEGIFALNFPKVGVMHTTFPVQLLEMIVNIGIFIYLLWYARKPHPRYYVLYIYLIIYAVVRFGLEYMRGDLVRGIAKGLSTSQWISIVLIIVGVGCMLIERFRKKKAYQSIS